jgi:hypothetical protein
MKSFYGVGQRKAKLFMNSLQKELEAQINEQKEKRGENTL